MLQKLDFMEIVEIFSDNKSRKILVNILLSSFLLCVFGLNIYFLTIFLFLHVDHSTLSSYTAHSGYLLFCVYFGMHS